MAGNKAEAKQRLFGPSPEEVADFQRRQGHAEDMAWANVPQGRGHMVNAAAAGRYGGRLLGGAMGLVDPSQERANLLQEAQQEVAEMGFGLESNPKEFYEAAYESLSKRGLVDEAQAARQQYMAYDAQQKERDIAQYEAVSNRIKALKDSSSTSKNVEFMVSPDGTDMKQAQKGSEAMEELLAKGYTPYVKPDGLKGLAKTMADGNNELVKMLMEGEGDEEWFKARAKSAIDVEEDIFARATLGMDLARDINTIEASLESGGTTFGAAAENRRALASVFQTFLPEGAEEVKEFLEMDFTSYDSVERSSNTILARLAKDFSGGSRMTKAALQTLAKAGPSVFLTNEGLRAITELFRKEAAYRVDLANYVAELPDRDRQNISSLAHKWRAANYDNPKYNVTEAEIKRLQQLEKKNTRIKAIMDKAKPLPMRRNSSGSMTADEAKLRPEQYYNFQEGIVRWDPIKRKFYKVNFDD